VIEQGRVSAVKKTKDGIRVTFKKDRWMEPTFSCTSTGRIMAFESAGKPIYRRVARSPASTR
jgi:hypothetical protein